MPIDRPGCLCAFLLPLPLPTYLATPTEPLLRPFFLFSFSFSLSLSLDASPLIQRNSRRLSTPLAAIVSHGKSGWWEQRDLSRNSKRPCLSAITLFYFFLSLPLSLSSCCCYASFRSFHPLSARFYSLLRRVLPVTSLPSAFRHCLSLSFSLCRITRDGGNRSTLWERATISNFNRCARDESLSFSRLGSLLFSLVLSYLARPGQDRRSSSATARFGLSSIEKKKKREKAVRSRNGDSTRRVLFLPLLRFRIGLDFLGRFSGVTRATCVAGDCSRRLRSKVDSELDRGDAIPLDSVQTPRGKYREFIYFIARRFLWNRQWIFRF